MLHYSFLVGWASCPSGADKMPTPQDLFSLHYFSLATPLVVDWQA
ncbi:hypothetical protein [Anabaena azotica]|nr:hypothetical protein [Anabaena azotica]